MPRGYLSRRAACCPRNPHVPRSAPVGGELLEPLVPRVRDPQVPGGRVDRDVARLAELPDGRLRRRGRERRHRVAVDVEALDPIAAVLRHADVAVAVQRQLARATELSGSGPLLTEVEQRDTTERVDLDLRLDRVDDVDAADGVVHEHAAKVAGERTDRGGIAREPERTEVRAVRGDHVDAPVDGVGEVVRPLAATSMP